MAFVRRVYYKKADGAVLMWYRTQGAFVPKSVEQDYEDEEMLRGYRERRDEVGLMEWTAPEEAIEQAFDSAYRVSVDVAANPLALVFACEPIALSGEPISRD